MQTFIDTVLREEEKNKNSSKIFILPSRRAGNVLRKKLATLSINTSFAPLIFSIEEFIEHITNLKSASNTELAFTLYESYKEVIGIEAVSFQIFCTWSQPLLSDFNEIDRYLLNQDAILNHLKDVKEINDHWSTSKTDVVLNYINFWNSLFNIYTNFCENSLEKGTVHQGYIYRQAVETLEHYTNSHKNTRHIFLGFNALNNAEQHIIQALLSTQNTIVYWDSEEHFISKNTHEAGMFIRRYLKDWKFYQENPFLWKSKNYLNDKNINIFAASQNIHQAKTVGQLLSSYTEEKVSKTAIILGDESLLIPILNSLPSNIKNVNVTMGIPLGKTPLSSFFEQLITLKKQSLERGFYYKDLLTLLQHPLASTLLKGLKLKIESYIKTKNKIYVTYEELNLVKSPSVIEIFFKPWNDKAHNALNNIISIIQVIRQALDESKNRLQLEYLYGFHTVFNKLSYLLQTHSYIEDINTFIYFYREIISSETIDLKGDPEKGLQIMGVLESRVLDFERVIMTSVNEGVLPSGKSQNSYIPYDLKRHYNLPTYIEKDAIYAYHFYHLLHRAQHIDILYTTQAEGIGSAEPSRFIRQIIQEKIHSVKQYTVTPSILKKEPREKSIQKTDAIIHQIKSLLQGGISPSALTTYLRNPIVFYERYILKVNQSDEVEETVAANTMGTIVHNTLETLYKPYIHKQLTEAIIDDLLKKITVEVKNQFSITYGLSHISEGKNRIIYEIICRYVQNYLKQEKNSIKKGDIIIIKGLETDLKQIPLATNIHLRGKVDLVEQRNGNLNIIDYKTGKVTQKDLNLSEWNHLLLPEGKFEKAFQVLMYAYMMHKKEPLSFPVSVGVISFKNLQSGFLPFKFNKDSQITENTLLEFESILKQVIEEILDPEIPFSVNE